MEDKWKEIFEQNKPKILEEFELPKGHEERFMAKLKQQKPQIQRKDYNYWRVAAILIPLCMLTVYYFLEFRPDSTSPGSNEVQLAAYSKDLNEAESHFSFIVEQNIKKVKSLETPENQQLIEDSFAELRKLESDYSKLIQDLKQSGGNPQVVRSILMNLQLQVEVLENVLHQIEIIQEFKNNQNETI